MNWNLIKEKYPRALSRYTNISISLLAMADFSQYQRNIRDLYDFFDGEGIYIDVRPFYYDGWQFLSSLVTPGLESIDCEGGATRTEAEEQAFMKAFEILEEKIK